MPLGWPTLASCSVVVALVLWRERQAPQPLLRRVSWGLLLLVSGLFVLVEGLMRTGVVDALAAMLRSSDQTSPGATAAGAGIGIAFASNLFNNLPLGLIAGTTMQSIPASAGHASTLMHGAIAIGIDIGPNLSVTGSLATILWLTAIRAEGERVSAWQFLRLGIVVMPLALLAALSGLFLANAL
jgi:arsenical pump membrane protein